MTMKIITFPILNRSASKINFLFYLAQFTTIELGSGFPDSSAGKESTCNAGNPSSILGLGRSRGEGISYPLQYSWASLVAQTIKESACNVGYLGSIPVLGRFPWKRAW